MDRPSFPKTSTQNIDGFQVEQFETFPIPATPFSAKSMVSTDLPAFLSICQPVDTDLDFSQDFSQSQASADPLQITSSIPGAQGNILDHITAAPADVALTPEAKIAPETISSTERPKRSNAGRHSGRELTIPVNYPRKARRRAYHKKCVHGKRASRCAECGGSEICVHKRIRISCRECGGASICEHNRQRNRCKDCGGSQICHHGKERNR